MRGRHIRRSQENKIDFISQPLGAKDAGTEQDPRLLKKLRLQRMQAQHKRSKHVLIAAAVCVTAVFSVWAAQAMGLFDITLGAEVSSSASPSSPAPEPAGTAAPSEPESTLSSVPAVLPTTAPESRDEAVPPSSAPPDAPAYEELFPELTVPKGDYIEHDPDDKVIYLTFDDGPCESTKTLLDKLDELGVKATFFVTAQFGGKDEILRDIQDMADRGNAVGVHTYCHNYKEIYSSVDAFLKDYQKMDEWIVEATGERSHIFRFPGGSNAGYNAKIRKPLLQEMDRRGFIYHDWNAHNGDSESVPPEKQAELAIEEASLGSKSVILMHNTPDKDATIEALPKIVTKLKELGYRFDILDETVRPFQFVSPED